MKYLAPKPWTQILPTLVHPFTSRLMIAKYCFELGIELKRIEVIADDESEIIEAVRRMSSKYDMVVTSGGIGPTHDDMVILPTPLLSIIILTFYLDVSIHRKGI
jgi:hypothetical protein